jgi:purine-cytosine permease-like protein
MADSRGRKSSWVLVALALVVLIGWLAVNIFAGAPNTR